MNDLVLRRVLPFQLLAGEVKKARRCNNRYLTRHRVAAILTVIFVVGCGGESSVAPPEPPPVVTQLLVTKALTPTNISGVVGAIAPARPTVRVTDQKTGAPVVNERVDFSAPFNLAVGDSQGIVEFPVAFTDRDGVATAGSWTFGNRTGVSRINVAVENAYQLAFSATLTHDVPDHFSVEYSPQVAAFTHGTIQGPIVQLEDRFSNPITSEPVLFTITSGGGSAVPVDLSSDEWPNSALTWSWHLGDTPGENRAVLSATGVDSLLFITQALDSAALSWYTLTALRYQGRTLAPWQGGYVMDRIGFAPFNNCLCVTQSGVMARMSQWTGTTEAYLSFGTFSFRADTLAVASDSRTLRGEDFSYLQLLLQEYSNGRAAWFQSVYDRDR